MAVLSPGDFLQTTAAELKGFMLLKVFEKGSFPRLFKVATLIRKDLTCEKRIASFDFQENRALRIKDLFE